MVDDEADLDYLFRDAYDLFKDCHSIDKFLSKPIIMSELIAEVQKHVNKVEIKQSSNQ